MTFNKLRKYIAYFLRDIREECLITQEDIAKNSKFTLKEIRAFESGTYFDYLIFIYYCTEFDVYEDILNLISRLKIGDENGEIKD